MGKATNLLRKGAELAREHKWHEAVEVYLQATEKAPTDSHCWLGLGVCLFRVGNCGMARVALERSEKMGHPKAARALAWLDNAERLRGASPYPDRRSDQEAGPPRPEVLPEEERIDLGRPIRVMLVEDVEADSQAIKTSIEGTIKNAEVFPVLFTVSCSDTLSRSVHYDVAVLDWDAQPSAAAGLTQILKIKQADMLIVCLTDHWDPQKHIKILEAGGDLNLVKDPHFRSVLPLIIAHQLRRDASAAKQSHAEGATSPAEGGPDWQVTGDAAVLANVLNEGVNTLQCGIVALDAQGRITWLNSAAADLLCGDTDALLGGDYMELLSQSLEDKAESPQSFIEVVAIAHRAGEKLQELPLRLDASQDGKALRYWSTPLEDGSPAVRRVEHYYPAEEAVAARAPVDQTGDELVARIIEAAGDVLFTTDAQGNITWSSPAAATTGSGWQQLQGMAIAALFAPDSREEVQDLVHQALTEGMRARKRELPIAHADGKRRWAELTLIPFKDGQEQASGLKGLLRDVTDRKITKEIRAILSDNCAI